LKTNFQGTRIPCLRRQDSLSKICSLIVGSEESANKSAHRVCPSTVTSGQYAAEKSASKLCPSTAVDKQLLVNKSHAAAISKILILNH